MKRRGYDDIDINCPWCNCTNDVDHLLQCKHLPIVKLREDALAAHLPIDNSNALRHWILGSIDSLSGSDKSIALAIGGNFLLAASTLRKL